MMRYDLVKPCATCPFRADGKGIRLTKTRLAELASYAGWSGAEFQCHETVNWDAVDGIEDEDLQARTMAELPGAQHCAGALIFGIKTGGPHQMARICERLGMFDPAKLEEHFTLVVEDEDALQALAITRHPRRKGARR